jgi:hypothetical protein
MIKTQHFWNWICFHPQVNSFWTMDEAQKPINSMYLTLLWAFLSFSAGQEVPSYGSSPPSQEHTTYLHVKPDEYRPPFPSHLYFGLQNCLFISGSVTTFWILLRSLHRHSVPYHLFHFSNNIRQNNEITQCGIYIEVLISPWLFLFSYLQHNKKNFSWMGYRS